MALNGINFGNFGQNVAQQPQRPVEKPPIVNNGPGTLYVRDFFTPSGNFMTMQAPHGPQVAQAAQQQAGGGAKIVASYMDEPAVSSDSGYFSPDMQRFRSESMEPAQARELLMNDSARSASHFLNDQSDYLERASKSDIKNSAVNFSLGMSKASESRSIYEEAIAAIDTPPPKEGEQPIGMAGQMAAQMLNSGNSEVTAHNYAKAFGVGLDDLRSEDKETREGARSQLQQSIIDNVSRTFDQDKGVGKAMDRWDDAVEKFESNSNSVVIAGSNEGMVEENMEAGVGGRQLRLPADFETNLLENDLVTSVGSVDGNTNGTSRSDYSSDSPGVDIYANGDLTTPGGDINGTSFAAPRVSTTMAELHRLHPDKSSQQIETLMKNRLTTNGTNGNSGIKILRPDANLAFLRNSTY